ncbi:MAG: T9SS type A sorting domain-containing protein [Bacteroidota bacterium]
MDIKPVSYAGNVKDTICRDIFITNTGNSTLFSGITIIDTYGPSIEVFSTSLDSITPDTANNQLTIFIPDSILPSYGLMPDSFFVISECLTINECTETDQGTNLGESNFEYYWQCDSIICQIDSVTANALVPVDHISRLSVSPNYIVKDFCFGPNNNSNIEVILSNEGTGPAFDVDFSLFSGALMAMDTTSITLTDSAGNIINDTLIILDTAFTCRDSIVKQISWPLGDIKPGEFFTINLNSITCCPDTSDAPCGSTYSKALSYKLNYREQCDEDTIVRTGTGSMFYESTFMKQEYWDGPTDLDDTADTTPFDGDTGIFSFKNVDYRLWEGDSTEMLQATFIFNGGLCYIDTNNIDSSLVIYNPDLNNYWLPQTIIIDINPITCAGTVTAWFDFDEQDSNFVIPNSEFKIRLIAQCDAPSASYIDLEVSHLPSVDTSCSDICAIPLACQQGVTFVHCPGCVRHGSDHLSFTMSRINYGEPDNNNNGIADTSGQLDFSKVATTTAMMGDTLLGVLSSTVSKLYYPNNPTPHGFGYGYYEITIPPKCADAVTPIGAKVLIYDKDTTDGTGTPGDTTYTFFIPQSKVETLSFGKYFFDLSIDTIQNNYGVTSSFQRFHWDDKVTVMPMFKVTKNIGAKTVLCSPIINHIYMGIGPRPDYDVASCCDCKPIPIINTSTNDTILIIDPVTGDSCITGVILTSGDTVCQCDSTVQYFCENNGGKFRLMGYTFYRNKGVSKNDCAHGVHISNRLDVGAKPGINRFPYEYRDWGFTDTLSINLPTGFGLDSVTISQYRTAGGVFEIQKIYDAEPDSIFTDINDDTVLTFNMDKYYTSDSTWAFAGSDSLYYSDDDSRFGLSAWFHPTCETRDTSMSIPGFIGFTPLFDADTNTSFAEPPISIPFEYFAPSFDLQPTLVTVDGVTRTACWDMHITNASRGSAFNTWLSVNSPSCNIDVTSITPTQGQQADIFFIGDFDPFIAVDVRICANYDCKDPTGKDTLIVYLGWDCPYYPDSLGVYPCEPDSFIFILQPRTSGLQSSIVLNDNKDSIVICNTIPVEVYISSSDVANVYDIAVEQTIPAGMSFQAQSGRLEYPIGTVVAYSLNPIFSGDTIIWYMDTLNTFIQNNGLPGSGFTKVPDSTELTIFYNLISGCSLVPQHKTVINVYGISNCRDSIILPIFTKTLKIIDYPQPNIKTVEVSAEDFSVCDSSATINVVIVNADTVVTDTFDLFNFILPNCVSYNNSFTGILNPPADINPDINGNILTWNLPDSVDPDDSIVFSFEVKITNDSCGNITYNYEGNTTVPDSLFCDITGTNCYFDIPAGEDSTSNKLRIPLSTVISATHVTCNGDCDGNATITVNGGRTPYIYSWSNGDTTTTIDNLCADTFIVTVIDADSCTIIDTVIITEPDVLIAQIIDSTDALCNSVCDGRAIVSVTGGTTPYYYLWSNGETDSTDTVLCDGTHSVTVTDTNGCIASDSVIINEPVLLISEMTDSTDALCAGACNGTATVFGSGGTQPYTYLWTNGDTTFLADSLCAGQLYIVTLTDTNGCTTVSSVTISEPDAFAHKKPKVEELVVCTEDPFEIKFSNFSCDTIDSVTIIAMMPYGLIYTSGSVMSNMDTIIEQNISIPNSPVFTIPMIPPDSGVSIDYNAVTSCGIIPHFSSGILIIDSTFIEYTVNNYAHEQVLKNTESHNVLYSNLVITEIDERNASGKVKDTIQRTITVMNGGNITATRLILVDKYPGGMTIFSTDTGILINGTGADTIIVDSISLLPGESIKIMESIKLFGCDIEVKRIINSKISVLGCVAGNCINDYDYASITVIPFLPGKPIITVSQNISNSFNYCGNNGRMEFRISNSGYEDSLHVNAGMAWNFNFKIKINESVTVLDSFTVNGAIIPNSIIGYDSVNGNYIIHFVNLNQDIDGPGGISDLNGDSVFAELAVGNTLIIGFNIQLSYVQGQSSEFVYYYVGEGEAIYKDFCGITRKVSNPPPHWDVLPNIVCKNDLYEIAPLEINNLDTVSINLCMNSTIYTVGPAISCPLNQHFTYLNLPEGYRIASPVTFKGDTIMVDTLNANTLILLGGSKQGCYNFDITLDNCIGANSVEQQDTIAYALIYRCDTGICQKTIAEKVFTITSHYNDCGLPPSSCLYTYGLNVQRTTFGWTDETKNTLVTDTTPGIRLDAAYVFDSIRVEAKGVVVGGIFDTAHVKITYVMPDNMNILTFSDAEVAIVRSGITSIFTLSPPVISVAGTDPATFTLDFDISHYADSLVILPPDFIPDDSITLIANFVVEEPAYLDSLNSDIISRFTARHYGIFQGDTLGCGTRKQDFTFMCIRDTFEVDSRYICGEIRTKLFWKQFNCCNSFFPYEFRNYIRLDTILKVFIPNGYEYVDSSGQFVSFNSPPIDNLMPDTIDTASSAGDTLYFIENWPVGYEFNLNLSLLPEDVCPPNTPLSWILSYLQYDYADSIYKKKTVSKIIAPLPFSQPFLQNPYPNSIDSLNLIPSHPVSSTTDTIIFTMRICNSSADSIWIALNHPANQVEYLYLIDITDSLYDTLSPFIHTDSMTIWFFIKKECRSIRVIAQTDICINDKIRIYTGEACSDFPNDIDRYFCLGPNNTFRIEPDQAVMQTHFFPVASAGIDSCTPSAYEIDIINSKFKTITDIKLTVSIPAGFSIDSSEIQYPANSSYRGMLAPDTLSSNVFSWTIDSVDSLIGLNGLTGIDEFDKSRLNLRVYFNVDSVHDFALDTPLVTFNISGNPKCNPPALFTHQADPMLVKPVNAAFNFTPFSIYEGDTVSFTSVDQTGQHLWVIYDQADTLQKDSLFISNPDYVFDTAGAYTIIHIILKICDTVLASDTIILQDLNVLFRLAPLPIDTCFNCASIGPNLISDPSFTIDYDCFTGPPANFFTNLTWACQPKDYGWVRYAITDDAAPWYPDLQGNDHTSSGNTNFFLGSIISKFMGGIRMAQTVEAGKTYNISIWVRNVFQPDCLSGGEDCLPSFALYVYNQSAEVIAIRNRVSHQDGWVQLCGEYSPLENEQIHIVIWAISGEFTLGGEYYFSFTDIHIGFDDFEVFEQELPVIDITSSDTIICSNDPSGVTLTAFPLDTGQAGVITYLWSTGDSTASITVFPDTTTTYWVIGTDAYGCSVTESITIEVNIINANITTDGSTVICRLPGNTFQNVTLTASHADSYSWSTGKTSQSIIVNQAGIYSVWVMSSFGCTDSAFIQITQSNQPPPQAKAGNDVIINCGDAVLLGKPGPTPNLLFDWTPVTGLDDPYIRRPLASPVISFTYSLTVTSTKTECLNKDDVTVKVLNPCCNHSCKTGSPGSGNSEEENLKEAPFTDDVATDKATISAYPNPFRDRTIIGVYIPGHFINKNEVVIFDVIGKETKRYSLKPGQNFIEIKPNELEQGIYFYSLISNGIKIETKKMVHIK